MAFNKQMNTQYLNFIKQAGYQYSKDALGFYFDNGMNRFSIMKTGPTFETYLNKKMDSAWILKGKGGNTIDFTQCLMWILQNIQKGV